MKVQGGKSVYGASLGILMLDARFPRIPGDMGNALSWHFPVQYRGAAGALPLFVDAARDLVASGVDGITTNCGFLSLFQEELAAAVDVPVATSSLMQVNLVDAVLPPGKRCGILTISGSTLTDKHLSAAGVAPDTPIGSTEGMREFTRVILGDELELDVAAAEADNVDAARALVAAHPDLGAVVLECTNMVPYAAAIRRAIGLPVFSIHSFVTWFQSGLVPKGFPAPG